MRNSLLHLYRYYKEYGFKCTLAFYLCMLFPYSDTKNGGWKQKIQKYKHKTITNYLYRYYLYAAGLEVEKASCGNDHSDSIWTAWLQGEENAPEVIRMTLASIKAFANGHPVVVVSLDNVDQYIDIPNGIKAKHESGIMSHAHYADVIRMMILAKYGGLWLDATTLLHEPVPQEAFQAPFFSVGFRKTNGEKYISKNKWLVAVIGGEANSQYLIAISRMLSRYWEEHDTAIDYFVFDYMVYILYQNDESFRVIADNLTKMENYTHALGKIINEPFDEETLKKFYGDGQIYILTYRGKYNKQTSDGHMTIYGYLYNHFVGKQSGGE